MSRTHVWDLGCRRMHTKRDATPTPELLRRLLYGSEPGHVVTVLILLAGIVIAGSYLLGDGWGDLGVAMTLYAAAITILIFGWTLRDYVRLRRDEVDVAAVAAFLGDLGVEKYSHGSLNAGQVAALASVADRPQATIIKEVQLCLSPDSPAKRNRIVLLFDGSIWQITIGGAQGGYNVQALLQVAVSDARP